MNKKILFICILSFSLSYYLPMKKKSIDFADDICFYKDEIHHTNYRYVMGCEKGKYCTVLGSNSNNYEIHKCVPYTPLIKMLGDSCEEDSDCDNDNGNDLQCSDKKCSIKNDKAYNYNGNYYCPPGKIATYESTIWKCINKGTNSDKCSIDTTLNKADYFKVCGKKNYDAAYAVKSTDMNYIGEVEDGNPVQNPKACKSGYALKFYRNGERTPPTGSTDKDLFCVTVKEVEYTESDPPGNPTCRIKYTKGTETEYIYNSVSNSNSDNIECNKFLMTKLELFQKYLERMNSIKAQCESERHYDNPFLCNDNELKKLQYFYDHPEEYLLYQNENQVVDYLVQTKYKTYEAQDLNGITFLNMNYFLLLLLFLISL